MPSSDPQQCDCRTLGSSPSLLPIAKRVHADLDGSGELGLSESDEAPQRHDVLAGREAPLQAVRDFLHFRFGTFDWAIFNFADVFLVTGAIIYDLGVCDRLQLRVATSNSIA